VAGILLISPTRHVMLHLNACCKWKEYIRTKRELLTKLKNTNLKSKREAILEIKEIQQGDKLWTQVIEYAKNCSWRAGAVLAKNMEKNLFSDWERVLVALDGTDIVGYCTVQKKDCIPDVEYSPYICFLFVGESYRGRRLSQELIIHALEYFKYLGCSKAYLVSGEIGLYEKYGFSKIADKKDIWGNEEQIFVIDIKG